MSRTPKRRAKPLKIDFSEEIAVLVGSEEQKFMVHKSFLVEHSDFFRAALNGEWLESKERCVKLPEADPAIFPYYLQWVCTGQVVVMDGKFDDAALKDEQDPFVSTTFTRLTRLWTLADQLRTLPLRNAIIDECLLFRKESGFVPGSQHVSIAWKGTMKGATMRQLLLHFYAADLDTKLLESEMLAREYGADFLSELVLLLTNMA